MPKGGARTGAGRKPRQTAVVLGMNGARLPPSAPVLAPIDDALAVPPADLPPKMRPFWSTWAPLALSQGTLTRATMPGMRELCELATFKQAVERRIRRIGAAAPEAQSLLRNYLKLSQRLDAAMARFKLTAFGKPEAAALVKKPAVNPWAAVARPKEANQA